MQRIRFFVCWTESKVLLKKFMWECLFGTFAVLGGVSHSTNSGQWRRKNHLKRYISGPETLSCHCLVLCLHIRDDVFFQVLRRTWFWKVKDGWQSSGYRHFRKITLSSLLLYFRTAFVNVFSLVSIWKSYWRLTKTTKTLKG